MINEGQLVAAASTAVVQAMTTDTYQSVRDRIKGFFFRHSREPEKAIAQLDGYSELMATGTSSGNPALYATLTSIVEREFASVINGNIQALESLQELASSLVREGSNSGDMMVQGDVVIKNNKAKGDQFIAGRDNHIVRRYQRDDDD